MLAQQNNMRFHFNGPWLQTVTNDDGDKPIAIQLSKGNNNDNNNNNININNNMWL